MELAVIAPKKHLLRYCRTGYHLVLAHLMDDSDYVKFYRESATGYIILDNSVMELGEAVNVDFLEKAVMQFRPNELVLPDVPHDADATFRNAQMHAPYFKDKWPNMKLMVVPQGKDLACWMKDFYRYLQIPEVDTIGIPKHRKELRLAILGAISNDRPRQWNYHLLGTWGNPVDGLVTATGLYPWLRGVDSKIPVRLGRMGIALHPERVLLTGDRYSLPGLDLDSEDDPFPIITVHNIEVMRRWTDGAATTSAAEGSLGKLLRLPSAG